MGFFDGLFGKKRHNEVLLAPRKPHEIEQQRARAPVSELPPVHDEHMPDMLDLGWYYSEQKDQLQMAKIPLKDRGVHTYVIGGSGSGKTKFLEFLIEQDVHLGNGFGIIDPHGDLIEDTKGFIAKYYHDREDKRIFDRVVLVDPTDPTYTVAFNVLEILPGVAPIEQAQELIMVFKRIWADAWGARMEDLLRNSLIALGQAERTLVDLPQFLTRQDFRTQVMTNVSHQLTRLYFERFDSLSRANQLQWSDPVTNKVNAFLADERVSQMLAYPKSTVTLRDIMDNKKILLLKLNKGQLRDSAELLGSLFMAKIQLAAFSRANIPEAQRVPFYLYIDEFQNFASDSFSVVLSEARKYGLALIMAHQTLEQIPAELRSVILGNAGKAKPQEAPQTQTAPPEPEPQVATSQLDEQQQAFLEYVIANPETPYTTVYKSLGVGMWKGNQLRDSLKAQGFIEEIETRLGRGSRRALFFIPTFTAFELVGKEPPAGRGGAIHRHIQQLIEMGASANGFTAQSEYDLGNGGIVDVHLEKGDIRIAVEIAVASRPSREIAHIQNCLAVGYARVYDVFVDEKMRQKTQEALVGGFSAAEREKVQLIHVSKLSDLVYSIVSVVGGRVNLPAELTPGE